MVTAILAGVMADEVCTAVVAAVLHNFSTVYTLFFPKIIYFICVVEVEAVKSDVAAVVVVAVIAEAALLQCHLWWQLQGLW
jgi:hypothetical protein